MCGIVGALTFNTFEKKSEERARTEAAIFITTQLLQMTVERGKDATGIATLWADGNYSGLKMGIPSPQFIARFGDKETEFKGMLKLWREYPKLWKIFMGHCRKASKGNSYDNKNNHPLQVGDIIFVHNGTLTNDDIIFKNMDIKRASEVDSEAVGHLLNYYTDGGKEPFTKEVIDEVTRRLHGTYSVLAGSGNNPYQAAQFRDGRPAEMVFVRPLKTVFIASEKKYLENVLFEYNKMLQLFNVGIALPYIKKDDVDFKTMVDDSYIIWDLTTEINTETTIDDLYDWGKTTLTADKIWDSPTKTNVYSSYNNNFNSTSKKTEVTANSPGSQGSGGSTEKKKTTKTLQDTESANDNGLVWSKSLNKFKTQKGFDKSKGLGSVLIDVDAGAVITVGNDENLDDISMAEVDDDSIENLVSNASEIKEVAIAKIQEEVKKTGKSTKSTDNKIVEIDMTTDDPEAITKAKEYIKGGLVKFEKDEEVIDALDLSDVSIIKSLPIFALANRIMKFVFSKGFIAGYSVAKQNFKTVPEPVKASENAKQLLVRVVSAEKKIAGLKAILLIVMHCLELRCKGNSPTAVKSMIDDGVSSVVRTSLPEFDFDNTFSVGDIKSMSLLPALRERLNKKSKN